MNMIRKPTCLTLLMLSAVIILMCSLSPSKAFAAPDAALFGQLPQAHHAAISPDGKQIAILQNHQGTYFINLVDLTGTSPQSDSLRVVGLGDSVQPQYVRWIDNHRVIVSVRQTQMYRDFPIKAGFLHLVDSNTLKASVVVKAPKKSIRQFNNVVLDWLEDDPDHIIMQFASERDEQSLPDVRKVEVATGKSKIVKRRFVGVNSWITDSNGVPRVGVGSRREGQKAFMRILDPTTGEWETAEDYPGLDPEGMSVVAVIDDGRSLVMSAYRGEDTRGLHRYDLAKKEWGEVIYQNGEYDVRDVLLSSDGNTIVGASFTGEATERVLFDAYGSTFEEALDYFEGYQVSFVDQSEDSKKLLLKVSGPSEPGGLYLYERGGEAQWLLDNMVGLDTDEMGVMISLSYKARDGQKIPAFMTLPPSINDPADLKNLPTIILPHGGPYSRDEKRFDYLAQFFATRGYLVLQMNFRGSAGYGKSFSEAGRSNWVVMQEDVEDGMRWLIEKGYANPSKSCIAGWSYGGYAALMGAAKTPELYKCSIAIAALSDIPEAISDAQSYLNGQARAERTFGSLMKDGGLMRANNPVQQADKIRVPVFLAHGEEDGSVHFGQYEKMKRRLEGADVDATFMSFKDEDHYMSNQANRQAMLEGIEAFLLKVNGKSPFILD